MSYHDFDASYVPMRNKIGKIVALHVGPHHKRSKTCVWVHKCLVTNLRGPNQTWMPKTKAQFVLYAYSSGGTSWVLDSGCTNHMTRERRIFTSFEKNECESDCIIFGDNSQGQVLGFGKIAITIEHLIFKVLLVKSLDYYLLSVSQLYEICYNCLFTDKGVIAFRRSDGSFAFKCVLRGKLYLVVFIPGEVELDRCLIAKTNMDWLWYRRLAHIGVRNLHKLQKDGHLLGLTNIVFEKDMSC
jgi:hypothetical protein